jgi:hypothetical protein
MIKIRNKSENVIINLTIFPLKVGGELPYATARWRGEMVDWEHPFDSANGKSHRNQERLSSEERRGGRALGVMKEVSRQQKSTENQRR